MIKSPSDFVFVACQPSATAFCRQEIAAKRPLWLPAFSRPGWLTFKITEPLAHRFELPATFARTCGYSLEQLKATEPQIVWEAIQPHLDQSGPFDTVHLWKRKGLGSEGKPLDPSDDFKHVAGELAQLVPGWNADHQTAEADARVLDIVRVDNGQWAIGWHVAGSAAQRWPGGVPELKPPSNMINRAWLKTSEALMWSGMPVARGSTCAEIGGAPGGSCQRLLKTGARVIVVDPAELHSDIAAHPSVTHLKMRGRDVPHRMLRKVDWLLVDPNIAPQSAIAMTEALATSRHTRLRGMLLTLKMVDAELVANLDGYMDQVRLWGFQWVKARHLAWGKQEICIAALRHKSVRRFRKK